MYSIAILIRGHIFVENQFQQQLILAQKGKTGHGL